MLATLLLTLAVFALAMLALAAGRMASGRSHHGSCGGGQEDPSEGEAGARGAAGPGCDRSDSRCGGCGRRH